MQIVAIMARSGPLPRRRRAETVDVRTKFIKRLTWREIVPQARRIEVPAMELDGSIATRTMRFGLKGCDQESARGAAVRAGLGARSVVLVGLMGCGKSSVGRRLASRLGLPFVDADDEIEAAAGKSIPDIFVEHGESHFREGERKVIQRLLARGPHVLATGGGAYMSEETRDNIRRSGICIWLKAELPVLMRRVAKRSNRPLLRQADPEAVMRNLMAARYPIYAEADITIDSRDVTHDVIVGECLEALARLPRLAGSADA